MVRDLGAFVLQLTAYFADQLSGLERFWTLSELLLDWISSMGGFRDQSIQLSCDPFYSTAREPAAAHRFDDAPLAILP